MKDIFESLVSLFRTAVPTLEEEVCFDNTCSTHSTDSAKTSLCDDNLLGIWFAGKQLCFTTRQFLYREGFEALVVESFKQCDGELSHHSTILEQVPVFLTDAEWSLEDFPDDLGLTVEMLQAHTYSDLFCSVRKLVECPVLARTNWMHFLPRLQPEFCCWISPL